MESAVKPTGKLKLSRVAFTGKLASMSRQEAHELVERAGGAATSAVNRGTTMLVVGMDGWPLLPDGSVSRKLAQAQALNRRRVRIQILSEEEFLERVGSRNRRPALRKSYHADQICDLVGLTSDQLRRWELAGLIRPHDGLYDFQDIVSLRTIAELVSGGVNPQTIGRSIRQLADVLPGTDRPLAQLKLVSEPNGTLLAEVGGALMAPDGQTILDFDSKPAVESTAMPLRSLAVSDDLDAAQWFARGVELEEQEQYEDALTAYREALARQGHFPEAQFNLANVLLALHKTEAAEERFRVALEQDPTMSVAWYNLASLQEAGGRLHDSVKSLQKAVAVDPGFADAHFNLASCYERLGQAANAAHHWKAYLSLDSSGEWADHARRSLTSA